jgi:hypothetical protein
MSKKQQRLASVPLPPPLGTMRRIDAIHHARLKTLAQKFEQAKTVVAELAAQRVLLQERETKAVDEMRQAGSVVVTAVREIATAMGIADDDFSHWTFDLQTFAVKRTS